MSPLSASYKPIQDVKISNCLMAHTDEYRLFWILFLNEALWFGMSLDHLLINPNHIQMIGIPVSDVLFGNVRKLGIYHKKMFICFGNDGMTIYFYSGVPTQRKIMECTRIFMMGDT